MARKENKSIDYSIRMGGLTIDLKIIGQKLTVEFSVSNGAHALPTAGELWNAGSELQQAAIDLGYRAKRSHLTRSVSRMREELIEAAEKGLWNPSLMGDRSVEEMVELMLEGSITRKWKEVCGGK